MDEVHVRLIDDMLETMRQAPGVGLAGNQVGVLERVFVYEVEDERGALVNPEFLERSSETEVDVEACLSIPGISYPVERSLRVLVRGLDEQGAPVEIEATDLLARVFQHEIDHLDGVLFLDRLDEASRREALATLRDQALGLADAAPVAEVKPEGSL